jgi:hypothetical protein
MGPQYTLRVDSGLCPIELHYIHARSPHAGAKPLLLTHGWPGSGFDSRRR